MDRRKRPNDGSGAPPNAKKDPRRSDIPTDMLESLMNMKDRHGSYPGRQMLNLKQKNQPNLVPEQKPNLEPVMRNNTALQEQNSIGMVLNRKVGVKVEAISYETTETSQNSSRNVKLNSFGQSYPFSYEKEEAWFLVLRDGIIKNSRDDLWSRGVEKYCGRFMQLFPIKWSFEKICKIIRETLDKDKFLGIDYHAGLLDSDDFYQLMDASIFQLNVDGTLGYFRGFLKENCERNEDLPVITKLSPQTLLIFLKELSKDENCLPMSDDALAVAFGNWTKRWCDKKKFQEFLAVVRPSIQASKGLTTFDKIRIMYIIQEKPSPEMIKCCKIYGDVQVSENGVLLSRYISKDGWDRIDFHRDFIDSEKLDLGYKLSFMDSDETFEQPIPHERETQNETCLNQDNAGLEGQNNVNLDQNIARMEFFFNHGLMEDARDFETEQQRNLERQPNLEPEVENNAATVEENCTGMVPNQEVSGPELDTAQPAQENPGFQQNKMDPKDQNSFVMFTHPRPIVSKNRQIIRNGSINESVVFKKFNASANLWKLRLVKEVQHQIGGKEKDGMEELRSTMDLQLLEKMEKMERNKRASDESASTSSNRQGIQSIPETQNQVEWINLAERQNNEVLDQMIFRMEEFNDAVMKLVRGLVAPNPEITDTPSSPTSTENPSASSTVHELLPIEHNGTMDARFLLDKFRVALIARNSPFLELVSKKTEEALCTVGEHDRIPLDKIRWVLSTKLIKLSAEMVKSELWTLSNSLNLRFAASCLESFIKALDSPTLDLQLEYAIRLRNMYCDVQERIPGKVVTNKFSSILEDFIRFIERPDE